MEQYQYKAFISYRHMSPDQEIAKKLHSYIENFHIPGSIQKSSGIQKMGRVFRDQEELPLSTNLGDDIKNALDHSEWLICICSPRYLESRWCMTELDYFIGLGRRDHILTILVEGEPEDSFPQQLRFETTDGVTEEKEPLAADVRGADLTESLKKLKNEKLRIFAPMLAVNYDELRQRARRRKTQIIIAIAALIVVVLAAFLAFVVIKNRQIGQERDRTLISQSKYLSSRSQESLENGDRMLALLLAREALPGSSSVPERPLTQEAQAALYGAMLSGKGSDTYQGICVIDTGSEITNYRSNDDSLAVFNSKAKDKDYLKYYDLQTGKQEEAASILTDKPVSIGFRESLSPHIFYNDHLDSVTSAEDIDTFPLPQIEPYTDWLMKSTDYSFAYLNEDYLCLRYMYFGMTTLSTDDLGVGAFYDVVALNDSDSSFLVLTTNNENRVIELNASNPQYPSAGKGEYLHVYVSEEDYSNKLSVSYDNEAICAYGLTTAYIWRHQTEELVQTLSSDDFSDWFQQIEFIPKNDVSLMAINCGSAVYIYDYIKGEAVQQLNLGLATVNHIEWNSDGTKILAACADNCARIFSADTGEVLGEIPADFEINEAVYAGQSVFEHATSDETILLVGSSKVAVYSAKAEEDAGLMTQLDDYDPYHIFQGGVFSQDGTKVWYIDTSTYYSSDLLQMADAATGKVLKNEEIEDISSLVRAGNTVLVGGLDENSKTTLSFYDSNEGKLLETVHPSYPHVISDGSEKIDNSDGFLLVNGVASPGGRYVVFSSSDEDLFEEDTAYVYVYDAENRNELWHIGIEDSTTETASALGFTETEGDDSEFVSATAQFLDESKIIVYYKFYKFTGYEIRNIATGEVLEKGILSEDEEEASSDELQEESPRPEETFFFGEGMAYLASDGIRDAETDKLILPFTFGAFSIITSSDDGQSLLIKYHLMQDDYYAVLRYADLKTLLAGSEKILDGRELTEEEKERFFIE